MRIATAQNRSNCLYSLCLQIYKYIFVFKFILHIIIIYIHIGFIYTFYIYHCSLRTSSQICIQAYIRNKCSCDIQFVFVFVCAQYCWMKMKVAIKRKIVNDKRRLVFQPKTEWYIMQNKRLSILLSYILCIFIFIFIYMKSSDEKIHKL